MSENPARNGMQRDHCKGPRSYTLLAKVSRRIARRTLFPPHIAVLVWHLNQRRVAKCELSMLRPGLQGRVPTIACEHFLTEMFTILFLLLHSLIS